MTEKYLVINAGSSSLKFSLYEIIDGKEKEILKGLIERIGIDGGYKLETNNKVLKDKINIPNHTEAVKIMLEKLIQYKFINNIDEIKGVGHRVLHGEEYYSDSVIIDDEVLEIIKSLEHLGPNHIPGEVAGIESMKVILPDAVQVAVFDTAFHQTMEKEEYIYSIPYEYYEKYKIRKYGFHGTSHKYIYEKTKKILEEKNILNPQIISCHLGNGCSITAIKNGKSLNNTMGFTPLSGLIMGTRSGDIDESIPAFICKKDNINIEECTRILNKKSGLLGISGISSDIRDLLEEEKKGNERAILALRKFEKSITKNIAQAMINLDRIDAIVFTAGIGENVASIRLNAIKPLESLLGIKIDNEQNEQIASYKEKKEGLITTKDSKIAVYVIPTNEELMILKDTIRLKKEREKTIKRKVLK